jgi:hypothetical protein
MTDKTPKNIDFFFDPVCPWAWITSRWIVNLTELIDLKVNWKYISLKFLNEHRIDEDYTDEYKRIHLLGLELHRVIEGYSQAEGPQIRGELYGALGYKIHNQGQRSDLFEVANIETFLKDNGFNPKYGQLAHDSSYDAIIKAENDLAIDRAGKDLGTPIISFDPPNGYSFFGPVISNIPKGKDAVELFNAIYTIANFKGFSELKREIREERCFD